MADQRTLGVYAARVRDYAELIDAAAPNPNLERFVAALPAGARVLDLGCGPAQDAARMRDAGLQVAAWDACPEMAAFARDRYGIAVEVKRFDQLDAAAAFDGVWANFSLLHLPKAEMPGVLARIRRALVTGGQFCLGLKTGTGEARDSLGRFYAYYEADEIDRLLRDAGFTVMCHTTGRDRGFEGTPQPWIVIDVHA